jgi:hypothetical protein
MGFSSRSPLAAPVRVAAPWLALALLFAASCWQAPLYYSNQNQYFLHGLAAGGVGQLADDWLARTRDPTPLFSTLVACTVRYLHPWVFYGVFALLQGIYLVSLLALGDVVAGPAGWPRRLVFAALLVFVHSALVRWGSYRWLGQDYPWFLQAGVAGQYVLGAALQPSVFGVLLVASLALFAHERPLLAAASAGLATLFHATYLLPAALLTLGYLTTLLVERRRQLALGVAGLALVLAAPAAICTLVAFGPTSADLFHQSQAILVDIRIPHHCQVRLWLDAVAELQLAWVVLALALLFRQRLFLVLAVPALLGTVLTLVQLTTDSPSLALLFPWRISTILVPVATTIILVRLVALLPDLAVLWARSVALGVLALCVAGGVWLGYNREGFSSDDNELPLLDFVRRNHQPGEVVFLPVTLPELAKKTRGSLSTDFRPVAAKKQDGRVIPVDLQRFRLETGSPIFIDFKSVPYRDTEVLEWYRRVLVAQDVLELLKEGKTETAGALLRSQGVTHLVLPAGQGVEGRDLRLVHADETYHLYRLQTDSEP